MEPCRKSGGPPPKAKYYSVTDRAQYCEGKVKRTPGRGVKEYLKPCVYKQWKYYQMYNRVLFVERSGELLLLARLIT